ncbi:MAG: HD domain-containing protein [Deltaproteobacteria bacterium]|jgi:HD-GYP domain-containing protein (c-di-GMP phosphodiesterase class II)|nr:HD domain-containing protein [Deltaproteobacteria bacterium]
MSPEPQALQATAPPTAPQPVEIITQSLLRLPQLVKIHQPNNKIFVENLALFQNSLLKLWEETKEIAIRSHRGKLYLNQLKIKPTPTMLITVTKLMEFLDTRGFFGFVFTKKEDLSTDDIISFIKTINQSQGQTDPAGFLEKALAESWARPIINPDFKIAFVFSSDVEARAKGRPLVWNSGTRTLAIKARKSYSRALAAVTGLQEKLMDGNQINMSKSRRVVQDMVETLFQEEKLLLNLSTIRDYDDYTCTHCVNVAILSMCLGRRLGLSKVAVVTLGLAGLFHDLGKVDVPIDLIRKTTSFTNEEYETVKNHSLYSVSRILQINADHKLKQKLIIAPFEHHLGVDLKGYPHSDHHAPLSLFGRIVAITDHYDALTSSRSYRPVPMNPEEALDIMTSIAGRTLDPLLLKVFISMVGIYPIGTLLILDSREVAMVAETPPNAIDARPLAYLLDKDSNYILKGELINLSDTDAQGNFLRNILRCFHPADFGLNSADILL